MMQNKPRALVVDDEKQMTAIVAFALETQGFQCDCVHQAREAKELIRREKYQLIVLDVLLPTLSGIELTRQIRAIGCDTPIILLTALGEEAQRIRGLEAGADDYITKPFSPRELALRAQAIIRRSTPTIAPTALSLGQLTIDTRRMNATWNGTLLTESFTEVRLLWILANNQNEVVPTRKLITQVWNTTDLAGGREMLKTTVYRLRKKMQHIGLDAGCIASHRGLGYALETENLQAVTLKKA